MVKLFSLINGRKVQLAPGQKVVSSEEYSELQNASEILKTVRMEALEFKQSVAAECETLKEQAFQEGFQEGLKSLNAHILVLDKELSAIREDVHKKILPLALKAAKKIIGEELHLHPERIVDIIMTALKPVTQHRKIVIYANRADIDALEEGKPQIKQMFDHLQSFSLQERSDIEPGGCMIETEAGIINAQLENQWRALEMAFASFMKKKP